MDTNRKIRRNLCIAIAFSVLTFIACVPDGTTETVPAPTEAPTTAPVTPEPSPESTSPIAHLQSAAVQILAQVRSGGMLETIWTGSGTIISSDGLVLTNAHVASPQSPGVAALYNSADLALAPDLDALVVALTIEEDRPPVETYLAQVVAADGPLDLAVIQITHTVDGDPIDPSDLDLPFVELGDSDAVHIGDDLLVFGYPGAGGETVTFTRGAVSGFESQDFVGDRAWIKTDTTFSPGNSGGLAANEQGQLIGVPSWVREARGGATNRMRAINLAKDMIAAVESGRSYQSPYVVQGTGNETFALQSWAQDFDDSGCPVGPMNTFPSNTSAVVAVFSYDSMTDGEDFFEAWFINDELAFANVWSWEGGASGSCSPYYVYDRQGNPLPEGAYQVILAAGPQLDVVARAETSVGEQTVSGVQVVGQITDADTGRGIPGALIVVLRPGSDLAAWMDNPVDADVYTGARADDNGYYQLEELLVRGVRYPAIVGAEGYFNTGSDGYIQLSETAARQVTIDIELTK